MSAKELQTIPARKGRAVRLSKGDSIKVINTHGSQVVDTWAFNSQDLGEPMSMEHTRSALLRTIPKPRDTMVTNKRRPILTLLEDTCGVHDTLMSACDIYRYQGLGVTEYHDSCTDNLHSGMKQLGELVPETAVSPFNLWMNVPVARPPSYDLKFMAPTSQPGDFVIFKAEMDCIVAFSACPQDILPVNGIGEGKFQGRIHDCHFAVLPAKEP